MTSLEKTPARVSGWKKVLRTTARALKAARPLTPNPALFRQGASFNDFLLLEDSFESPVPGIDAPVTMFVTKDGSLGAAFWLSPMPHETLTEEDLAARTDRIVDALGAASLKGRVAGLTFQLISDVEPDDATFPASLGSGGDTFASHIARVRFEALSTYAEAPRNGMRLVRRRLLLTVRMSGEHPLCGAGVIGVSDELDHASLVFGRRVRALGEVLSKLHAGLVAASFQPRVACREDLLAFLRDTFHSLAQRRREPVRHCLPSKATRPLGEQALYHAIDVCPSGVGVGCDAWQAATLLEMPETTTMGMGIRLMSLTQTHRVVVNLRPVTKGAGLSFKRALVAHATDAQGIRLRDDLDAVDDRLQGNEVLMALSWHIFVRNESVALSTLADERLGEGGAMGGVASRLTAAFGTTLREETLCAPLVFASCLPFQNSPELVSLVGREMLTPSHNAVSLLPLFGGFKGSSLPMMQMMSRGGERLFLNPRDAQGASHVAILGGSGGGKSFLTANLICSFLAAHPKGRVFIIDKKTSYGVLARLAEEESSAQFLSPPANFPNIFRGGCDEDVLPSIVGLFQTAISLVSPRMEMAAQESRILSDSICAAFEEKERQAVSAFDPHTGQISRIETSHMALPTLSDVVSHLESACAALDFPETIARKLREALSPFVGRGPYARFFDSPGVKERHAKAPQITLCDLDGVASDPILIVLTVQAVILEIARLVRPKPGENPEPSLLIIEEVGVLAGESPALVSFIRDAWKTLRKFGVTCVGLTNEVSDFTSKPGPQEIWNVSPNKILLKQSTSTVNTMRQAILEGKNGLVRSGFECDLLDSLEMVKGAFADGLWMGDSGVGTYVYAPTGFDYWCAASDPIELATVASVAGALRSHTSRPMFHAVAALAMAFPSGVRSGKETRSLTPEEHLAAVAQGLSLGRTGGVP